MFDGFWFFLWLIYIWAAMDEDFETTENRWKFWLFLNPPGLFSERQNMKVGLFSSPPLSKYRVLCLFYVLLRLNAWCYAVKYEEQICSELSICSARQISLHYDNVK